MLAYRDVDIAPGAHPVVLFSHGNNGTRIQSIFPQAPAAAFFTPAFFESITIPTLIVGGTIDETTPFDANQQMPSR